MGVMEGIIKRFYRTWKNPIFALAFTLLFFIEFENANYIDPTSTSVALYVGCVNLSDSTTWVQGSVTLVENVSNIYYIDSNVTLCLGNYTINVSSGQAALYMNCTHCYLNCNGSTLNGTDASGTSGIENEGKTNVIIRNCIIQNFASGIYFYNHADSGWLQNNTANSNTYYGFHLYSSSNNILTDNIASNNRDRGFYLKDNSNNNNLTNNNASFNYHGFYLSDSSNGNILTNNTANSNNFGFYLYSSSNNNFTNNTVMFNEYGVYLSSASLDNRFYLDMIKNNTKDGAFIYFNSHYNEFNECSICFNGLADASHLDVNDTGTGNTYPGSACENPSGLCSRSCYEKIRIFVTDDWWQGDLGGIVGADDKCQQAAEIAGLGGRWHALISTSEVDARDRIPNSVYVRLDDEIIAYSKEDLFDGLIINLINITEYTTLVATARNVWTASNNDGTYTGLGCEDWTASGPPPYGTIGQSWRETAWMFSGDGTCNNYCSLYCFNVPDNGFTVRYEISNASIIDKPISVKPKELNTFVRSYVKEVKDKMYKESNMTQKKN